jgi:NitT/TauT family transport system substrate-binding protein
MKRRIAAIPALCALFALAACSSSTEGSAAAPERINVTVSNATEPYVIPWLAARAQGFFEKRGVIVEDIVPSKGGSTSLRNLLSGDLPIGEVGLPSVVDSTIAGAPVTVVGGATQSVNGLDFYALNSNTKVQTINDVKKWAFTSPHSVTNALTHLLPDAAGTSATVERTASGGVGEGVALLESGAVDVAVVPTTVVAKEKDKFRLVVSSSDFLKSFQQSVITTTPEYAKSHPKVVQAVVAGYQDGVDWIAKNPHEAAVLYADYSEVSVEVAESVVNKAIAVRNWGAGFNAEAINAAVAAMKVSGYTGGVSYCGVFDKSFIPSDIASSLPEECK